MNKTVIRLNNFKDIENVKRYRKGLYYLYYKDDGDLYMFDSEHNKEINLFRFKLSQNGTLSINFLNSNGTPIANTDFTLSCNNVVVKHFKTNYNGYATFTLPSETYTIHSPIDHGSITEIFVSEPYKNYYVESSDIMLFPITGIKVIPNLETITTITI